MKMTTPTIAAALALAACAPQPRAICPHDLPADKFGRLVEVCRADTPDWSRPLIPEREPRDEQPEKPEPKPEPKPEKPKPEPKPDPCACGPDWVQKGAA